MLYLAGFREDRGLGLYLERLGWIYLECDGLEVTLMWRFPELQPGVLTDLGIPGWQWSGG